MKIDLDAIVSAISPSPIVLMIGGKDYTVREMKLSDVLLLEALGQANDADTVSFVKGMFKSDTPPVLDQLLQLGERLDQNRARAASIDVVAAYKNQQWTKAVDAAKAAGDEPATSPGLITSDDVIKACGGLPAALSGFDETEEKYLAAVNVLGIITSAIAMAVVETTPKNSMTAAVPMIRRQIKDQLPSADSPA